MNYLAHLTLSFDDEDHLIGNFIADGLRSVHYPLLKPRVLQGVRLHHFIDQFTDQHPLVEKGKARLRAKHGKYAGVILDIFYDHFLALHYAQYGRQELEAFSQEVYRVFENRDQELSPRTRRILPYMKQGNWLLNYAQKEGLARAMEGMAKRARFKNRMAEAPQALEEYYHSYEFEFQQFYPQLEAAAKDFVASL
jgi:acyl carrier protein phosphodiesterase